MLLKPNMLKTKKRYLHGVFKNICITTFKKYLPNQMLEGNDKYNMIIFTTNMCV